MSHQNQSLISLSKLSEIDIISLFKQTLHLQENSEKNMPFPPIMGTAGLLFFENSTRTKLSFENACYRSGLVPYGLDANSGSSLAKGESVEDTILNVAQMGARVLIVRCGDQLNLEKLSCELPIPIVNAGWGKKGHPTQALLDLYTIWKKKGLENLRVLFLGDVVHSRVAASHFEIFDRLNIQIGICGPAEFKPMNLPSHFQWFDYLKDGLQWANTINLLRVQFERHSKEIHLNSETYHETYGLNKKTLDWVSPETMILHPGPVNRGIELTQEVFLDPRSQILEQVNNGVFVRTAILSNILGGPK